MTEAASSSRKAAPRKKKWAPKVKTGCVTCRIRRVKCDEAKPRCLRCTSTGRVCDGYTSPTPSSPSEQQHPPPPSTSTAITVHPSYGLGLSNRPLEEQEAFYFYTTITTQEIFSGTFGMTNVLLQLSQGLPALWHALVAMGAMHKSFLTKAPNILVTCSESFEEERFDSMHGTGNVFGPYELVDYSTRFALTQRCHSIRYVVSKHRSGGYLDGAVTLAMSVIYACLSLLQGHFAEMLFHLDNGCKLLQEMQHSAHLLSTPEPKSDSALADMLISVSSPVMFRIISYNPILTRIEGRLRKGRATKGIKDGQWVDTMILDCLFEQTEMLLSALTVFTTSIQRLNELNRNEEPAESKHVPGATFDNGESSGPTQYAQYYQTIRKLDAIEMKLLHAEAQMDKEDHQSANYENVTRALHTLEMGRELAAGVLSAMEASTSADKRHQKLSDMHFNNVVEKARLFIGADEHDLDHLASHLGSGLPAAAATSSPSSPCSPSPSPSSTSPSPSSSSASASSSSPPPPSSSYQEGNTQERRLSSLSIRTLSAERIPIPKTEPPHTSHNSLTRSRGSFSPYQQPLPYDPARLQQDSARRMSQPPTWTPSSPSPVTASIARLFGVAHLCRNPTIRRKAIALLLHYPHREGLWDSQVAGATMLELMRVEEEADQTKPRRVVGPGVEEDRIHELTMRYTGPRSAVVMYRTARQVLDGKKGVEKEICWPRFDTPSPEATSCFDEEDKDKGKTTATESR